LHHESDMLNTPTYHSASYHTAPRNARVSVLERSYGSSAWTRILIIVMCFLVLSPLEAKNRKGKKANVEEYIYDDPDPVTRRAKPDSQPRTLTQPNIFANSRGSYRGRYGQEGIDVSHYQGNIDWKRVSRNRQIQYVFIKASEGGNIVDDCYERNVREARRHGLKVGSYHFYRANVSAEVQFRNFMSVVQVRHQDMLPIIDVEKTNGVSDNLFHSRLQELLRMVETEFGRPPIIYTGKNFYNKYFYGRNYRRYPFMIACYTPFNEPSLMGNDDFIIWQYSASESVDGIRGDVDASRFVRNHSLGEILLQR